ncbi:MAG: GAF domain-containing protein [Candidatus Eisenbacteria sp.]|nr:GAF domain-containing protein [Candidatus Eisenbacteria bacterium]
MTPRQRNPRGHDHSHSTLRMDDECSRGGTGADSQLSAVVQTGLALQAATDPDEAWRTALSALIDPEVLGYGLALLFLLDEREGVLGGHAAALLNTPTPRASAREQALQRSENSEPSSTTDDFQRLMIEQSSATRPGALSGAVRAIRIPLESGAEDALVRTLQATRPVILPADEVSMIRDILPRRPHRPDRLILVPVPGAGGPCGVLVLGDPSGDESDRSQQLPLAELTARHLGLALERLQTQWNSREWLSAYETIREAAKTILAATNLPDVLELTSRVATQVTGAERAMLWTCDEATGELTLAGENSAVTSHALDVVLPFLQHLAQRCARQGGALLFRDLQEEQETGPESLAQPLAAILVPLKALGEMLGVLAVIGKRPAEPWPRDHFTQEDEDLLSSLGGQAAGALLRARLFSRLRNAEVRLVDTQRTLVEIEKMAALGELSAKLLEEMRKPLSVIAGFAHRLENRLGDGDPSKEDAAIIAREITGLEELLAQEMQVAPAGKPRLAMRQLNEVVHESVILLREEMMGQGVCLEEIYAEGIPELLLDGDRVRQVVINIMHDALVSVRDGDTIRIETLRQGDRVLLEIANTGEQLPGTILERLFVPFATSRPAGRGLGLAVAHQIVREHGGEISVRSEDEWGAVFTISFPIRANQDRRKLRNRRGKKDRRDHQGEEPT